jgi:3,4-dihydroxy 2-butanone 4-phosphate synthase/GTP cyclohydrolase II
MQDKLKKVFEKFKQNKPVVVFDSAKRENEADFVFPSQIITPAIVNFMISKGKGLLCVSILKKRQQELGLDLMLLNGGNDTMFNTKFTYSIDLKDPSVTTGITAKERAATIKSITNSNLTDQNYTKPGHVFPLVADDGLLSSRRGHTEASLVLAQMAGYYPSGALIEILNDEGERANYQECTKIAAEFDLEIIYIEELANHNLL